jgi:transcriptional regulator
MSRTRQTVDTDTATATAIVTAKQGERMHVPPMYRAADPSWVSALILNNPLATLVTVHDGAPMASNVPVIVGPEQADGEPMTLVGHMNRMNPQWAAIGRGCPALVIFNGPHSYVSPSYYGFTPAAPTWNFCVVQAAGALTPFPAGAPTLAIIKATVEALEGQFGAGWQMGESLGYFDDLVPGVGAFAVRVERLDAMYKLSQEQEPRIREQVADALESHHAADGCQVVEMMRRSLAADRG